MTHDEIHAGIIEREAELADVRADLVNGPQDNPPADLIARRAELVKEIAGLKAMLEEA